MKKLLLLSCLSFGVYANDVKPELVDNALDHAQVIQVKAVQSQNGTWCFHTTVEHNDQGWKHYADAWQVTDLTGNILGERVLAHPHDNEQPFTRSLCNIVIAKPIKQVLFRAKCNVHGWGNQTVSVNLTAMSGDNFIVEYANEAIKAHEHDKQ